MTDETEVIFLGINDAGMRIYDWLCEREGVVVHSMLTTESQLEVVADVEPDYVVSCGYRHIVPEGVLGVPEGGCINIHPALLPYNRGANPNVWSIVEETPAGVTLHHMDETLDTGSIIAQREVETCFADTGKDLYERLEDAQYELFTETWPSIVAGECKATDQAPDAGSYHTTADFEQLCELGPDEQVRVKQFLDRLRALTFPPYNNACIEVGGDRYYVDVDITRES
jgi:methionyl-tRNA formyltransferase